MYALDKNAGNQPQTWRPHSLVPRNAISLPMAGNDPKALRPKVPARVKQACPRKRAGLGCSSCAGTCSSAGLGDFTIGGVDMSTLGWTGYAALGVGLWLVSKVLFTGSNAKARRKAYRSLDADYRIKKDEIAKQYPRF